MGSLGIPVDCIVKEDSVEAWLCWLLEGVLSVALNILEEVDWEAGNAFRVPLFVVMGSSPLMVGKLLPALLRSRFACALALLFPLPAKRTLPAA